MSTIYFTASSIDGYIVDDNGSLEWLTSRDVDPAGPFGYQAFSQSVGALVMGATTYEWVVTDRPETWPYPQPTWVLTHRPEIVRPDHPVQPFAGNVADLYPELLRAAGYKDVWVVGGGDAAAQFVRAGLVDELVVSYAPCTLGTGGRLLPTKSEWSLIESAINRDFVCARWRRTGGQA
jgi:dihydrofolate reductase